MSNNGAMIDLLIPPDELKWLNEQLARYTYKPGWEFTIDLEQSWIVRHGSPTRLVISFETADTRKPGESVRVNSKYSIPCWLHQFRESRGFTKFLISCIHNTEIHESREWLCIDGAIYDDPHK
jgi:hypothetical protein